MKKNKTVKNPAAEGSITLTKGDGTKKNLKSDKKPEASAAAGATDTKKTKKDTGDADKANLAKGAKDAKAETTAREVKYLYPEDAKTATAKKTFRRNARAAKARFEKEIGKLQQSDKPEDAKQLKKVLADHAKWEADTYAKTTA